MLFEGRNLKSEFGFFPQSTQSRRREHKELGTQFTMITAKALRRSQTMKNLQRAKNYELKTHTRFNRKGRKEIAKNTKNRELGTMNSTYDYNR